MKRTRDDEGAKGASLADFFSVLREIEDREGGKGHNIGVRNTLAGYLEHIRDHHPDDISRVMSLLDPDFPTRAGPAIALAISTWSSAPLARVQASHKEKRSWKAVIRELSAAPTPSHSEAPTIRDFTETIQSLCRVTGKKATERRAALLADLLSRLDRGQEYVVDIVLNSLRVGVNQDTALEALGRALGHEDSSLIREAFGRRADIAAVSSLLVRGVSPENICVKLGTPVQPMLSKPFDDIGKCLDKLSSDASQLCCEYKYDGERVQLHWQGKDEKIEIFSRNLKRSEYPGIVAPLCKYLSETIGERDAILDGEIVAYDPEKEKILPFQVLSRKDREGTRERIYFFDFLLLGDEDLTGKPFRERREILDYLLGEDDYAARANCLWLEEGGGSPVERAAEFMTRAVSNACEGLIVKNLNQPYMPGKKGWGKLKKDYLESTADTFDLVVIGASRGTGRKSQIFSSFLLACRGADGELVPLCSCGTGLTDADLADLQDMELGEDLHVSNAIKPDVWLVPSLVWEVAAADVTSSDVYPGGISLRFPRHVRLRKDKNVEQITELAVIRALLPASSAT